LGPAVALRGLDGGAAAVGDYSPAACSASASAPAA
jgi:hypothetical protein